MKSFVCVLCALGLSLPCRASRTGEGTAYSSPMDMDATGLNMCEFDQRKLATKWRQS